MSASDKGLIMVVLGVAIQIAAYGVHRNRFSLALLALSLIALGSAIEQWRGQP